MMAFFKGFESFPSIAVGNVVQFTKPLLFQIFRISFTRSATPPKVIDYSFNPLIKRATTFLFSQFHKFFLNVLSNMPYVKLIQDVLQEFSHIGLNLFVSICCNTANFDTILVRERCGSLEYDQIDCPSTCKSHILHCTQRSHTYHHQANGFPTLLLHFQTAMLYQLYKPNEYQDKGASFGWNRMSID